MTIGFHKGVCRLCGKTDALNEGICAAHSAEVAQAYLFGFADGQATPPDPDGGGVRENDWDNEAYQRGLKMGHKNNAFRESVWMAHRDRLESEIDGLQKQLAALRAPAPDKGWRTMDTAPKDGTPIQLALPNAANGYAQVVGWWEPEFEWETDYSQEPSEEGEYPGKYRGAWTDGGIQSDENPTEYLPHFWQPLPPPPDGKEAE